MQFLETKKLKILSFLFNFILVFGLIWMPVPSKFSLPEEFQLMDFYLTIIFAVPLFFQFLYIFKKTGFSIDEEKILIYFPFYWNQTVHWNEVKGLRFFKFFSITYLLIDLKEPKNWYKGKKGFKRFYFKWIERQFKTPIRIPLQNLKEKPTKIVENIQQILSIKKTI